MKRIFLMLLTIIFLQNSAQAEDRIRIGFSALIASYSSLPLGQKRGFLQEEGLQAEFIRMNATVGLATLVTGEIDYYTSIGPGVAALVSPRCERPSCATGSCESTTSPTRRPAPARC